MIPDDRLGSHEVTGAIGAGGMGEVLALPKLERLDRALNVLAALDEGKRVRSWRLKSFGGLSVDETDAVWHVSSKTVMRDWSSFKAWLRREMLREDER